MQPYILLANGKQYWFEDPDPAVIDLDVIAGALSRLCRFSGHCKRFYSVAEHSIWVAHCVPEEDRLEALMHDAAESMVVDIPSPLKPLLKDYGDLEALAHKAVFERFGLRYPMPPSVKQADLRMLATERRDLMPPDKETWQVIAGVKPVERRIRDFDNWRGPTYWAAEFKRLWLEWGGQP
jgi:hypothetical protein